MEQKYSIKGVEKIIETAGKERLAQYYGVDIDSDFEDIITNDFKEHNIPNGLEVALYFSLTPEEYNKEVEEKNKLLNAQEAASEIYNQDERRRAMFGFNFMENMPEYDGNDLSRMINGTYGNVLYFFVDEPVKTEDIGDYIYSPQYMVGGVQYYGLMMGKVYYKEHEDELKKSLPDTSKKEVVKKYVNNFMYEFEDVEYRGGYGPKPKYEETEEIRKEKDENEKVILELTGKSNIDELSLKDYISLIRRLEKEEKDLQQEFENRFTNKDNEER